jgi:hypothetical protein
MVFIDFFFQKSFVSLSLSINATSRLLATTSFVFLKKYINISKHKLIESVEKYPTKCLAMNYLTTIIKTKHHQQQQQHDNYNNNNNNNNGHPTREATSSSA